MDLETARLQGAELREELQEAEEQHSQELEQLTNQVRVCYIDHLAPPPGQYRPPHVYTS